MSAAPTGAVRAFPAGSGGLPGRAGSQRRADAEHQRSPTSHWAIEAALPAVVFLTGSATTLFALEERLAVFPSEGWLEGVKAGAAKAIGAVEILTAMALILPALLEIATVFVPLAATGGLLLTAGTFVTRLQRDESVIAVDLAYSSPNGRHRDWGPGWSTDGRRPPGHTDSQGVRGVGAPADRARHGSRGGAGGGAGNRPLPVGVGRPAGDVWVGRPAGHRCGRRGGRSGPPRGTCTPAREGRACAMGTAAAASSRSTGAASMGRLSGRCWSGTEWHPGGGIRCVVPARSRAS
ncbi:DoxX family protein [Streptomyces sp. NBC_00047]|uniref:DoxX family protein n=1 Tax=Streptomyces sp. NBC_00047 TaxID=2975627 RepID=UPI002257D8A0|nr:DoxX family protein [Streptomyces sp. NBC_00047]MCX5613313.1 DoxX family protein [Streptomyces sp. NBC_00047]